jgi:hypothetical protein
VSPACIGAVGQDHGVDLSDEEADSAGPVKWVMPAWEVLAHDRAGWKGGLKSLRTNECE